MEYLGNFYNTVYLNCIITETSNTTLKVIHLRRYILVCHFFLLLTGLAKSRSQKSQTYFPYCHLLRRITSWPPANLPSLSKQESALFNHASSDPTPALAEIAPSHLLSHCCPLWERLAGVFDLHEGIPGFDLCHLMHETRGSLQQTEDIS